MAPSDRVRHDRTASGVAMIVASVFLLSFADAVVKYASAAFSLWQLYVARSLIAVPILLVLVLLVGHPAALRPKSFGWILLRSLLLAMMWVAYYAALPLMSLSAAAVALYTTPLFIALFSARLIGEPVGGTRWAGIAIGFIGVLVILRPDTSSFAAPMLLPIVAAVFYALAAVVTRSRCRDERPLVLSLSPNVCLLVIGTIASCAVAWSAAGSSEASVYPFLLASWTPMGAQEWSIMGLLAVLMVIVSVGVAAAYQSGPAAIIGTFDNAYLLFAALWGFLIFAETPDRATMTGMTLIAAAGALAIRQPPTGRCPTALMPPDRNRTPLV